MDGKRSELKKRQVANVDVLAGLFLPMKSSTDSKRQLRIVT
jgi:hypothetical protein